jgi:thiosulfate/3-mercaptopyruvate sulfurtransferase
MIRPILFALLLVFVANVGSAIASPLVDVAWLKNNPASQDRVLLDIRDRRSYAQAHIPGAVQTDYGTDGWRVTIRNVPGLLPTSGPAYKQLVRRIGQLGIGNSTHVILIAPGWSAGDMGMATRLYWTFKVLGHDQVSILDGGMQAWLAAKKADRRTPANPLKSGAQANAPQTFVPTLRKEMLMDRKTVTAARSSGQAALDARPTPQYLGLQKSGAVRVPGTLTGAHTLPGEWVTKNGGGQFRNPGALKKLLATTGVKQDDDMFVFCNTGHWASLTWFIASELLGNKKVRMYDGSLADWTAQKHAPLERKIKLN